MKWIARMICLVEGFRLAFRFSFRAIDFASKLFFRREILDSGRRGEEKHIHDLFVFCHVGNSLWKYWSGSAIIIGTEMNYRRIWSNVFAAEVTWAFIISSFSTNWICRDLLSKRKTIHDDKSASQVLLKHRIFAMKGVEHIRKYSMHLKSLHKFRNGRPRRAFDSTCGRRVNGQMFQQLCIQ